MMHGKANIR